MQLRKKEEKSRNTLFSQCFGARKDRKVGSPKRRVATFRNQNCGKLPGSAKAHLEAQLEVKMLKNTPFLHHFWKLSCWKSARCCGAKQISKSNLLKNCQVRSSFGLRCRKSARCCGGKHIWKSKWWRHAILVALSEVALLKTCTPLWQEAHFEVKTVKELSDLERFWKLRCRNGGHWTSLWQEAHLKFKNGKSTPFSVHFWKLSCWKVHATVAGSAFRIQNCEKLWDLEHFWKLRCPHRCGRKHVWKSKW